MYVCMHGLMMMMMIVCMRMEQQHLLIDRSIIHLLPNHQIIMISTHIIIMIYTMIQSPVATNMVCYAADDITSQQRQGTSIC